jgi:hypothetical protein
VRFVGVQPSLTPTPEPPKNRVQVRFWFAANGPVQFGSSVLNQTGTSLDPTPLKARGPHIEAAADVLFHYQEHEECKNNLAPITTWFVVRLPMMSACLQPFRYRHSQPLFPLRKRKRIMMSILAYSRYSYVLWSRPLLTPKTTPFI